MPHITFVHGIANKPSKDVLLDQWRVALLDDDGLDLDALGVTTSMAYWADILYPEPLPPEAAAESGPALQDAVGADDADLSWLADAPADEKEFVTGLGLKVGLEVGAAALAGTVDPDGPAADGEGGGGDNGADGGVVPGSALEAVPLPLFVTKRLMKVFLRDVHHYLYDSTFSPRPGETFQVRRDVRARATQALAEGAADPGPHVVVCHSLGTVIAYDVLTALEDTPRVDALVTLGSPLGISEVQKALAPPWTADDGWPTRCLVDGPWTNVADRLDPVCGPDPSIANEYRRRGEARVHDVRVANAGSWRHAVTKYLGQPDVRRAIREALGRPS